MTNIRRMLQAAAGQAGGAAGIDGIFNTFCYTGTGAARDIVNGVDLDGEGGMVWLKNRGTSDHNLFDTERGAGFGLRSNTNLAEFNNINTLSAFNDDGFSLGTTSINDLGQEYVGWTFRKAEKFFDVVTYTGDGGVRTIPHNLGIEPGCILVKRLDFDESWRVYHRGNFPPPEDAFLVLDTDASYSPDTGIWNSTLPTDTEFSVGASGAVNASGGQFVAYLFAHDDSDEGVIQCGEYTGNGVSQGPIVELGWEPQWIFIKRREAPDPWYIWDARRSIGAYSLSANESFPEGNNVTQIRALPQGFQPSAVGTAPNVSGAQYTYIAIRAPIPEVLTPTDVTFIDRYTGTGAGTILQIPADFPIDSLIITRGTGGNAVNGYNGPANGYHWPLFQNTNATSNRDFFNFNPQTGMEVGPGNDFNNAIPYSGYFFRKAPEFHAVIPYTGTGAARTLRHDLGVVPEYIFIRQMDSGGSGPILYYGVADKFIEFRGQDAEFTNTAYWNNTLATETEFSLGSALDVNGAGLNFTAMVFCSKAGFCDIGEYVGSASDVAVNCGFSAGARLVLLRNKAGGNWLAFDSATGITSGADTYFRLNIQTGAAVGNLITPLDSGFNAVAGDLANVDGDTFIYIAFA